MPSAFNPGYVIVLYINTELLWNFESLKKFLKYKFSMEL